MRETEKETRARALFAWLRARTEAMAALTLDLVRLESPGGDREALAAILARLAAELRARGMQIRTLSDVHGARHLLALPRGRRGRNRPRRVQLIVGHADTVWPRGTLRAMPAERRGDRLYGPGVLDMKAGLAQALFALSALEALGFTPALLPLFLITTDEEQGSPGSRRWVERLARLAERSFVLEPAAGRCGALKTARHGVGRFVFEVHGRAAHAALEPETGASAILELARQIPKLFSLNDRRRGVYVNVGEVHGGIGANVIAARARALLDVRVPDEALAGEIEAALRALEPHDPRTRLVVQGGFRRPPMPAEPRHEPLWRAAKGIGRALGLELEQAAVAGGSDANFTSRACATLDGLGAVGAGAHAPHEQVEIASMPERAALLAALLLEPPETESAWVRRRDAEGIRSRGGRPGARSVVRDLIEIEDARVDAGAQIEQ